MYKRQVRKIVDEAPAYLVAGGVLALEIMMGQNGQVEELLRERGFSEVNSRKDYGGIPRVVAGRL